MKKIVLCLALVIGAFVAAAPSGAVAQPVAVCTTTQSCRTDVAKMVASQDGTARTGSQWGPANARNCAIASREQEANEKRCRSYDRQQGGKTLHQCAKCFRQVREDLARWVQCSRIGYAPNPPSTIYRSLARLGHQTIALSHK